MVDPDDGDDDDDHGDPDDTVYHITTRPLSDVDRRRQINVRTPRHCLSDLSLSHVTHTHLFMLHSQFSLLSLSP